MSTDPIAPANSIYEEDIFAALGVGDLSDDEKGTLLVQMIDLVQDRTLGRVVDQLTPELQEELAKLSAEENSDEAFEVFIEKHVPNYEALFVEESKRLRHELIVKTAEAE